VVTDTDSSVALDNAGRPPSPSDPPPLQTTADRYSSLRTRIVVPLILLITVSMLILGLTVSHAAREVYARRLTVELARQARLVSVAIDPLDTSSLDEIVRRSADASDSRITVIRSDGAVLADSDRDPSTMANQAHTVEVRQALAGAVGSDERQSPAIGEEFLYAAVPFGTPPEYVVRVGLPSTVIDSVIANIQRGLILLTLTVAAVATYITFRLAHRISSPLHVLRLHAVALAGGRFSSHVVPSGPRELRELGHAFNAMTDVLRREITARERARQRLEAVLSSLADGVVLTDHSGTVIRINRAAATLLDVDAEESLGHPFMVVGRDYELASLLRDTLSDGTSRSATIEVGLGRRLLETSVLPVTGGGEELGLMVLRDVTEFRRLEAVRREFVANVSHELRTPLTAIKALVDTLEGGAIDDPEVAPTFLSRIVSEVDRLADLVDDLLDLGRLDSGRVTLRLTEVAPAELMSGGIERLIPLIERAHLSLTVDVAERLPNVRADQARIEQVLLNLVHNAVKFTPPGGELNLSATASRDVVRFNVRDSGIGIPHDELPRLFERFYKADKARRTDGTGLGLAIAKHIVQLHGGAIWADSTVGIGSTFSFTLPIVGPANG
jgi:two-component system phosphate regulon sensor histidine kinase PhoR